jgi:hypothetical protein
MNKNISIGVLLGIVAVLGFAAFKAPSVVTIPTDIKIDGSSFGTAKAPVVNVAAPNVTVRVPESSPAPVLGGALADIPSPYFTFGGVREWARRNTLAQATSTVCAIQSPVATSTLVGASIRFDLASTSAVSVDLAKGTTQYATTTKIGTTYSIAASAQATIVASSTGSVAGDATIFAPSTWFLVRINELSSSSGAGNAPTGICQAVFRQI